MLLFLTFDPSQPLILAPSSPSVTAKTNKRRTFLVFGIGMQCLALTYHNSLSAAHVSQDRR